MKFIVNDGIDALWLEAIEDDGSETTDERLLFGIKEFFVKQAKWYPYTVKELLEWIKEFRPHLYNKVFRLSALI